MKAKQNIKFVSTEFGRGSQSFQAICHEMYKSFGGAYKNLTPLATTPEAKELLTAQLHELRSKTRELLTKVHELNNG